MHSPFKKLNISFNEGKTGFTLTQQKQRFHQLTGIIMTIQHLSFPSNFPKKLKRKRKFIKI